MTFNNQRFGYMWLYFIGAFLFAGTVVWGLLSPSVTTPTDKLNYKYLHQNWSQIIDEERVPLDDIHNFKPVEEDKPLQFVCTLPDLYDGQILLFYSENQEVTCHVDDELVQNFTMNDGYKMLKTPGSAWNQVDFTSRMSGKELYLTIYSPLPEYKNNINKIYFMKNTDVDTIRLGNIGFKVGVTIAIFILMIVSFSSYHSWHNAYRKKYFFAATQFYLIILIILLCHLGFFELFFARPIMSFLIQQLFVRFIPVALWRLTVNSTDRFRHPKMVHSLRLLAGFNIIAPIILQFVFGISLLETLWIHNIIVLVVVISFTIMIFKKIIDFKKLSPTEYPCLATIFVFLGGLGDMIMCVAIPEQKNLSGICSAIGVSIYLATIYTIFNKQNARTELEKNKYENSYKKLKNTSLMQQINAHFLFNALNTISAFCKVDPHKADTAVITFSAYLRSFINFVDKEETIHILDELDLVENYLTIEQMRFGGIISFTIDIDYDDFYVPPFTVQTLVENAVVHGLLKQKNDGHICITTKRVGDFAQITIEDNGIGFDTTKPTEETSVGIKNIKKRTKLMVNGDIEITSKIGEGTKVVITIPVHEDDFEDFYDNFKEK